MLNKRRKTVMINKKFQVKLIVKFILLYILLMIIFSAVFYMFSNSEIETQLNRAHITFKNVQNLLFPIILTLSVLNIAVAAIIISTFVLFASFRIAGPLYRFNEALLEVGKKNLSPITQLRGNDQLYECSQTLTNTVDVIADDMQSIQKKLVVIEEKIAAGENAKTLIHDINELKDIINSYKI